MSPILQTNTNLMNSWASIAKMIIIWADIKIMLVTEKDCEFIARFYKMDEEWNTNKITKRVRNLKGNDKNAKEWSGLWP